MVVPAKAPRRPRPPKIVSADARYYTVAQVAMFLQLDKHKVYDMIKTGTLKARRIGKRPNSPLRIARREFDAEYGN